MTTNQAHTDAQYDPSPQRDGFRSQYRFNSYKSFFYLVLIGILILFVCKKVYIYSIVLFTSAIVLLYIERNENRTV